jgi:uncharacterized protein with PIN domain
MVISASKSKKTFCPLTSVERCDVCGSIGNAVSEEIIKKTVNLELDTYSGFYLCPNPKCSVEYFNKQEKIFVLKNDTVNIRT